MSGYAFVSYGRWATSRALITGNTFDSWQSLPENSYIAAWKFAPQNFTTLRTGVGAHQ